MSILDASIDAGIINAVGSATLNSNLNQIDNNSQVLQRHSSSGLRGASTSDLDLNMVGSSGFNCLHAACGSGNIEMTDYLLFKR